MLVTAHSWKSCIRKIQNKLTNFYENKVQYFEMVNRCMQLDLTLLQVEEK